ncbi:MAG TPA: sucrase ferredoxin [Acidimicrobiales bacterium]|nr:sucrase ferredoxin [Acidimicrobiales bacterium]
MNDLRCSPQLRAEGADPVGTAGSYAGFALVGAPLPWAADVAEVLPDVAAVLAGTGVRLQAVVPEGDDGDSVLHRRPDGPFAGYVRSVGALDALLAAQVGEGRRAGRDVLVCTHGRRDRCCGSFGTELWQDLARDGGPGDDVTLWRTSHTGGHRFAPTVVVLPEGTAWGWCDAEVVRRVLDRSGPIEAVLPHYRGCTGLPGPPLQAVERAVLAEVGWPLLDTWRDGTDLGGGRWRLATGLGTWEATVARGRRWPVPACGVALADLAAGGADGDGGGGGGKADVELLVERLERVA